MIIISGTKGGTVHDMGAAMEGGIGGHAGIFSNSMDVAKIMQLCRKEIMLTSNISQTFDDFNTCYFLC
jgi:hypothetical protein